MKPLAWLSLLACLSASASAQHPKEADEPVLGARAGFDLSTETAETVAVEAGSPLRAEPDLRAMEVISLPEAVELPVIERRGSWARVQYGHTRGWILLRELGGLPGGASAVSRLESLPAPEELADLKRHLVDGGREATLGPYRLLTDVTDAALLAKLDQLAGHLAEAYEQRFGLALPAAAGEVVALFADETRYRAYAAGSPEVADLGAPGHAGNGLAALALYRLSKADAPGLMVHEITHLMNRRALGPGDSLPSWLDEGLAEDLAYSAVTSAGKLRLGSLGGGLNTDGAVGDSPGQLGGRVEVTVSGPRVSLARLARTFGSNEVPSLGALFDLPWSAFSDPARRPTLYAMSAFFIRFLLDGEGAKRAAAFRAFLSSVAHGGSATSAALATALGDPIPELEAAFSAWLRVQSGLERPVRR